MNSPLNGQKARSLTTQRALMDAAEKLIARQGPHNVSIKDIVQEAGQKNESALQYHFKNLQGLIDALHRRRHVQTHEQRAELLESLLEKTDKPSLRDLCELMVIPTYSLAQADRGYRSYIAAFGHEIALADESAYSRVSKTGGGGESGQQTGELLRRALPHLDEKAFRARMDLAVRMSSAAMSQHARNKHRTRGAEAEFFISNLIDALEGLLSAPVSASTKAGGVKQK
jgi:AcrR family transcriptional regulator